jgi:hypothetical protein
LALGNFPSSGLSTHVHIYKSSKLAEIASFDDFGQMNPFLGRVKHLGVESLNIAVTHFSLILTLLFFVVV